MSPAPLRAALRRSLAVTALCMAAVTSVSACGSTPSTGGPSTPAPAVAASTPAASPEPNTVVPEATGAVVVKTATSSLGTILVDAKGLTLYGFTNDKATATSTCFGACAKAWPPLLVGLNDQAAPEINAGIVSTIIRTDGQRQFVVGPYPVYTYIGDTAPGDVSGSGLGGVWFPIAPDGTLITSGVAVDPGSSFPGATDTSSADTASTAATSDTAVAPASSADAPGYGTGTTAVADGVIGKGSTALGDVLTSANGLSLYGFLDDTADASHCVEGCAKAWPPLALPDDSLPAGLDPAVYSVGTRPDGTFQLKNGKWWLYNFAGDTKAGDTNGQASNDKWFVVGADGKLIKP